MKVGILTFHRAINYGALLQCYALQETLKKMGYDVFVINYAQRCIESKSSKKFCFKECIKACLLFWTFPSYIKSFSYIRRRAEISKDFQKNFNLTPLILNGTEIPNDFDLYIIGSDQVWSTIYTKNKSIDPIYSGFFPHRTESKLVGYAISMNKNSLDSISKNTLRKIGENFTYLSFREKSIKDKFYNITGIDAQVCLDPTLLTDGSLWDKFINTNRFGFNYVFVYEVRQKKDDESLLTKAANAIAKRNGYKIINASQYNTKSVYSVNDFLSLIKYSSCVITSSFHACAFSILFEKPFYAYCLHDGHDERYVNLMQNLDLIDLLLEPNEIPDAVPVVDYARVNLKLELLRSNSIKYLNHIRK